MIRGRLSLKIQPVKHDLQRRRTLKHKSVLLKQYGVYALTLSYATFCGYCLHKWLNPPEYKTQEEREKAQLKFGISDIITRLSGYVRALRETTDNKTELRELRVPTVTGKKSD